MQEYDLFESWIRPFFDASDVIPSISSSDVAVYFALLTIAHAAGGADMEFSVAIKTIESKSRLKKSAVYTSINRLSQAGIISARQSGGKAAAKYTLHPLNGRLTKHKSEHKPEHKRGLLDDYLDDDDTDRLSARARAGCRIWAEAFRSVPRGAQRDEIVAFSEKYDLDLLREAATAASMAGARNQIGYVRVTLAQWAAQGIRNIDQWAKMQVEYDREKGVL